jgi:hypothetical protein
MSKRKITIFLCDGKDCSRAWSRLGHSPSKWLKKQVKEAGLPYKLNIVKTECLDCCEEAAVLCIVARDRAAWERRLRGEEDADRLLATLRALAESTEADAQTITTNHTEA